MTTKANNLAISLKNNNTENDKQTNVIDKKLKKIEQLKKQVQKLEDTVNVARRLYDDHCKKVDEDFWKEKEQLIELLFKRFQQKGFSKWQKEMLESRLLSEIDRLLSSDYESEKTKEIYEQFNDLRVSSMGEEEKEMADFIAKSFFENMGLDMDGEDFSFEDLNNPDFQERMRQKQEQQYRDQHQEFHEQEEERKQTEQQQKNNTTNSDFQKLYKSLVKKAHPDLVTDPAEKEVREEWMKRLSTAWEERNYYELLVLQQEISADAEEISLTDSQIEPLITELNNKIKELEVKKFVIKKQDFDTSFYYENFNARSEKGILKKILEYKEYTEKEIIEIKEECLRMKTLKSTKELLVEVNDVMESNPFDMFDEDFDF